MNTSDRHEEESWETVHGPDCDGARAMVERGRRELLERLYEMSYDVPEGG